MALIMALTCALNDDQRLGQVRQWLKQPRQDVIAAYQKACDLAPDEDRFQRALALNENDARTSG